MGSPDLFKALSQTLGAWEGQTLPVQDVRLTPYLSVVTAILYMMAVDGEISDREVSQLQSVIGADAPILQRAVAYAQSHDVDTFLRNAAPILDEAARNCLLLNVADSLMADGELQMLELALFDRMLSAFGQKKQNFQPHFDAIAAKGRTSVLGDFDAAGAIDEMTPPKALVVSMLYMMSADGEMAPEEIGRLSAAIGGSQTLLKASLRYVSQVRAPEFLAQAVNILDKRQRVCILLNACDAMMSDGEVVAAERELLGRMMLMFGIEAAGLDAYLNTMRMKNDLPADTVRPTVSKKPNVSIGPRNGKAQEEGVVFERKRTWEEETGEAGDKRPAGRQTAAKSRPDDTREGPLDSRISSTMQDNIDRMSQGIDGDVTLQKMEQQARAEVTDKDAISRKPKGLAERRAIKDGQGVSDQRSTVDSAGATDIRSVADAEGAKDLRTNTDQQSSAGGRLAKDARSGADRRSLNDGNGPNDLRTAADSKGGADLRKAVDARGPSDLRKAVDGQGLVDTRTAMDAEGLADLRAAKDATGLLLSSPMRDAKMQDSALHWQDAVMPGQGQALYDAESPLSAKHLVDDRRDFDGDTPEDAIAAEAVPVIKGRMGAVRKRTNCIRDHVEALRLSRTLRAGSRLPALPPGPPRPITDNREYIALASSDVSSSAKKTHDGEHMLFASDEGGPRMTEQTAATTADEAKVNRLLRVRSAVLLPALFVTYGATMVGETLSERLFITNENMATDARIVHQMASVQQSVYRIAPEAVQLPTEAIVAASAGVTATVAGGTTEKVSSQHADMDGQTDREKAESFLEQRKNELMQSFKQHQSSSALAAERQQWFLYAKSIVLLGLGMAFWGVLFRSLQMLHGSTAAGLISLLLSANGYWLFFRF
jgi:uncharacterized tellurite resistance protein B-like protein